jgi:hypothetical protein
MNRKSLEQRSPMPLPPEKAILLDAFLTSYQPVSPHFLLRDVLPTLLQLDQGESSDADNDRLFVGAAVAALQKVPEKITIVTSCALPEENMASLPWLGSYVDWRMVGSDRDSIQHAKLWLCHWWRQDGEYLQITISSTNLTSDAFHGQLQAGWSICLPLAKARRGGSPHGVLCEFLDALGAAADCSGATSRFIQLLQRCPEIQGSHFITSIPGRHMGREQTSLLAGETAAGKVGIRILTPSIGEWNDKEIRAWCAMVGVPPDKVELFWPHRSHPWVGAAESLDPGLWKMPVAAQGALDAAGVRLLAVADPRVKPVLADGHPNDRRWCHAKFYGFRHGLMLGSHNWSKAAWGVPGGMPPKNFELSVFVENQSLPLHGPFQRFTGDVALMERLPADDEIHWLRWAQVTRKEITLTCAYRLRPGCTAMAEWQDGQDWYPFPPAVKQGKRWIATQLLDGPQPEKVRLVYPNADGEQFVLPITDIRPGRPLPAGLGNDVVHVAEDIELEQYGGPPVPSGPPRSRGKKGEKRAVSSTDYSLSWLLAARRWRQVVDTWREEIEFQPANVHLPLGLRLAGALERRAGNDPGAAIAAEELRLLVEEAQG